MKKFILLTLVFFVAFNARSQTDWSKIDDSSHFTYKPHLCVDMTNTYEYDVKKVAIETIGDDFAVVKLYNSNGVKIAHQVFYNVIIATNIDSYGNRNYMITNKYGEVYCATGTIEYKKGEKTIIQKVFILEETYFE